MENPALSGARCAVVIPARGGSKGIPGKNLKLVGGRSLIERSVAAALASRVASIVTVSTDDETIAQAAQQAGATVIPRPAEIAGDTATSEAAVLHALDWLEERGPLPDFVVLMQCTSPFTRAEHLDALLDAVQERGAACGLTVVEDHGFLWGLDAQGFGVGVNHDHLVQRRRRQELPPQFRENGALYVMRTDAFRRLRSRFCGPVVPVPMHAPHFEIDEELDLAVCDAIARVWDALPPAGGA
jgi:N-acylneuraminate cytidylyltransferase